MNQTNQSIRINTPLVTPDGFTIPVGGKIPTSLTRDLYAGKLSLALTSNQLIYGSVIGDPSKTNGAQFGISGPPSTFLGTNKTGGNDGVGRYSGVFGTRWNLNATAGKHKEKNELSGLGTSISQLTDVTTGTAPNINTGGFRGFTNSQYNRDVLKADLSAFVGPHTLKVGIDNEKLKAVVNRFLGGGDWVRKFCTVALSSPTGPCPAGKEYYRHEVFLNDLAPGFVRATPSTWLTSIANPLTVSPKTQNNALYGQDSWKILSNFTLNAGVRWEEQKVGDRLGATKIDLKNNWAPRVGAIWDPAIPSYPLMLLDAGYHIGKSFKVWSPGTPADATATVAAPVADDVNNFDPTGGHLTPDSAAPKFTATKLPYRILGTPITPVDPNLKAQYIDEYLAGYDYEIAPNFAVGIKGTYRNLGRVIEDELFDPVNGVYEITNPGIGAGAITGDINGDPTPIPAPKPTRRYKGLELHAEKRFSNNYQFYASYVWSRLEGNYDGTFQASTGQLDPNINSAYDYADFEVNNSGGGLLSNDRTHQLKFYGSYTLPTGLAKGLTAGAGFHYESGTPLTAMGYASSYRNFEYYLTPRGALGRGPADWEADLHGDYPIPVGSNRASIVLDVFNIFNRQAKNAVDIRYNLSSQATNANPCPGIPDALCNGDGGLQHQTGSTKPVGELPNPRASATNPNFLHAGTSFTGQRSFRLGARFTF